MMKCLLTKSFVIILCTIGCFATGFSQTESIIKLPGNSRAAWELDKAYRKATETREQVCINGLWLWQPAETRSSTVPAENWGYFKVPGCWPGITDYMQKDSQAVYSHPTWDNKNLRDIKRAWYRREITVPADWIDRRIYIQAQYVNSHATVYLDGKKAGVIIFPGGDLDITAVCQPGKKHVLSMYVESMPLKAVMLSYIDTASAREITGSVARRGLCGDVFLISIPKGPCISDAKVNTSVRKWEITIEAALNGLDDDAEYSLLARITDGDRDIKELTSRTFKGSDIKNDRFEFTEIFKPEKLWDIHTPENKYNLSVSLLKANGEVLDVYMPISFGFREFWINGRDFFLNGSRIFLSSVPLDNAQVGAAWATYTAARESMERLKSFGINFVYTHNYGCQPGSHLSFDEILRAADDTGMLVALSQPHFSHYDWDAPDADLNNGYARHAEFYVKIAQNHPSVVFYSMSHNATGYSEDMNPDMIDGIHNPRETWAMRNAERAVRAEAIVKKLDPYRIVYHHASGNLGPMHTSNFYANFAPVQEMSDWFGHWAETGVKPLFTCEYSVPFPWDWTMYRGWYKGQRSFGSARVPWEFCMAEWNAQFSGDQAFRISEMEKTNLRWEAGQFRNGNIWHRWDYPHAVGSSGFVERHDIYASYFTDNWRAFRTWGVSANSPWNHGHYWTLRQGVDKSRKEFQTDWDNLQKPGFSPDYIDQRYERVDLAFEYSDWIPTAAAQSLIRNNRPLLAYIAGKPGAFTSKDHNFYPGQTVEKQLVIINNSRQEVTCNCQWSFNLPRIVKGQQKVTIPTGQKKHIVLQFQLPTGLDDGVYDLDAAFSFDDGQRQTDSFSINILPHLISPRVSNKIALFDPKNQTAGLLDQMKIRYRHVDADSNLSQYEILIIGKEAITVEGPGPDIERVSDGMKVIIFEQTSDVLSRRLGFRVVNYGLRKVFPRVSNHPLLKGINPEHLVNWRGDSTINPARLKYEMRPSYGPTIKWCDIPVTRLWRCGNRGNVASVLIEKPARGDFMPILDGGFSLQYSPLIEYRNGSGMILFCQMDITGRTEVDPAARILAGNILQYVSSWQPTPGRKMIYSGDPVGLKHFESAGIRLSKYNGQSLSTDDILVVSPGGEQKLAADRENIAKWLKAGGYLLTIGLDEKQLNTFLPLEIHTKEGEHIAAYFQPFDFKSSFAGIGPADVHSREPKLLPLVSAGATVIGDGILARAENLNIISCQIAPWQYNYNQFYNLKRSYRRTSCLLTRLISNMGAAGQTPLLKNIGSPAGDDKRWLSSFYMDVPEEWDDPYRFFRW